MYRLRYLLFIFGLFLCSCGAFSEKPFRIGIDPYWFPIDFGNQQGDINAYIEELLQTISRKEQIDFKIIDANWDSIYDDLEKGVYQGIISSLTPLPKNETRFSFSEPLLKIGPVLVLKKDNSATSLNELSGRTILIVEGSSAKNILQQYPDVIVRTTSSIPDALNQIEEDSVTGAVIEAVYAESFMRGQYVDSLQIVGEPLSGEALRLITLKNSLLMRRFSKGLASLKEAELQALQKKWSL